MGGKPDIYEDKDNIFYHKNKYKEVSSLALEDYPFPWSIFFRYIFFTKNNTYFYINSYETAVLEPNIGFIFGDSQYEELLEENYFNELIEKQICQKETTNLTEYNLDAINFATNGYFNIFTCDKKKFVNAKNNYKKLFPPLKFFQEKSNINFTLTDEDLFIEIGNKFYFLVVFAENKEGKYFQPWFLGLPFFQKYQLFLNYDNKSIGFYDQNILVVQDNKKIFYEIFSLSKIIEGIIIVGLLIFAYYIGKMNRKKRKAFELDDDNYEYVAKNDKKKKKSKDSNDSLYNDGNETSLELSLNYNQ